MDDARKDTEHMYVVFSESNMHKKIGKGELLWNVCDVSVVYKRVLDHKSLTNLRGRGPDNQLVNQVTDDNLWTP